MNCQEAIRLANGYVDAELDAAGALAIEEHLRACPRCRAQLANLRALRDAVRRGTQFAAPPASLRERLQARYGRAATRRASLPRGLGLAGVGAAALLLVAAGFWAGGAARPGTQPAARVVVHVSDSASAGAILRNLAHHLEASPATRVVVVAHNDGVDFLLRGARDPSGQPFEAVVTKLKERGVDFRVCANTLSRRGLDAARVISQAALVPSGVAEVSRLQIEEGYAYPRL